MGCSDSPGFDVAPFNCGSGNLIASDGCGEDLISGNRRGSDLRGGNRPGNNYRSIQFFPVLRICQFLSRKPAGLCVDLIDQTVCPTNDQPLRSQSAGCDEPRLGRSGQR